MADFGREKRKKGEATLITALAAGKSVRQAARIAGVGERTITRYLADPAFRQQVDEAREKMLRRAVDMLGGASAAAVATLRKLMNADKEAVRLGAARSILELAAKLRHDMDLEERLAVVEDRLKGRELNGHLTPPSSASRNGFGRLA